MSAAFLSHRGSRGAGSFGSLLRRAAGREGNPLCRPVDRARSRLLVVLVVALLMVALASTLVAVIVLSGLRAQARSVAPHRHAVTATTIAAAHGVAPADTAPTRAVWAFPAGQRQNGLLPVAVGTPAGTKVSAWVDDRGVPAAAPAPDSRLAATATLDGLGVLTGAGTLVWGGFTVRRRVLDRRAERAWEPEWEQIEPHWSGRDHPAGGDC